jgi:hypothetical protein
MGKMIITPQITFDISEESDTSEAAVRIVQIWFEFKIKLLFKISLFRSLTRKVERLLNIMC